MKTILAATDFSEISINAVNYAFELANQNKAKLILFHAYHPPVIASDVTITLPTLDEIEEFSIKQLNKVGNRLKKKQGYDVDISCKTECGMAVDEIKTYVKKNKIDLVVIGMQGAGYLVEKLVGSVTTTLIRESDFPVLTINSGIKYKHPKKITLACDYVEVKNVKVLEPMKELARLYKSKVILLNVLNKADTRPTIEEAVACIKLEHAVEDIDHSFQYIKNSDVIEGINEFIRINKSDMLVMIPRKHTLLKNILKEPTSKRMAFHCTIPLLTLHE